MRGVRRCAVSVVVFRGVIRAVFALVFLGAVQLEFIDKDFYRMGLNLVSPPCGYPSLVFVAGLWCFWG